MLLAFVWLARILLHLRQYVGLQSKLQTLFRVLPFYHVNFSAFACVKFKMRLRTFQFQKKNSGGDTPRPSLPGGSDPLPDVPGLKSSGC